MTVLLQQDQLFMKWLLQCLKKAECEDQNAHKCNLESCYVQGVQRYWKSTENLQSLLEIFLAEFMCLLVNMTQNSCISQCTSRKRLAVNQD